MRILSAAFGFGLGFSTLACGSDVGVGANNAGGSGGDGAAAGSGGSTAGSGGSMTGGSGGSMTGGSGGSGGNAVMGPQVFVRLLSSHEPVAHNDGLSGQTPKDAALGIRNLTLFESASDQTGALIFEHGTGAIEAPLDDGSDTVVGQVNAQDLTAATYTRARVVVSHTRFTVDATVHVGGQAIPGTLQALIAMSGGAELDGTIRDQGFYRYVFGAFGMEFPLEGGGLDFPQLSSGGFEVKKEGDETAYYFPISLSVDPNVTGDVNMLFKVNMHEAFRWEDDAQPGYADGVFDVTPTGFEAVRQLGANSFALEMQ